MSWESRLPFDVIRRQVLQLLANSSHFSQTALMTMRDLFCVGWYNLTLCLRSKRKLSKTEFFIQNILFWKNGCRFFTPNLPQYAHILFYSYTRLEFINPRINRVSLSMSTIIFILLLLLFSPVLSVVVVVLCSRSRISFVAAALNKQTQQQQ